MDSLNYERLPLFFGFLHAAGVVVRKLLCLLNVVPVHLLRSIIKHRQSHVVLTHDSDLVTPHLHAHSQVVSPIPLLLIDEARRFAQDIHVVFLDFDFRELELRENLMEHSAAVKQVKRSDQVVKVKNSDLKV